MERGQVLVRAKVGKARVTADILDLEQGSFNSFVLGVLMKLGAVQGTTQGAEKAVQEVEYVVRKDRWSHYADQIR